jgi:hypothetical protein
MNVDNHHKSRILHRIVLAIALFSTGYACAEGDVKEAGDLLHCLGADTNVQRVRDNLEMALAYLKSSKDNFGPSRQIAIELTEEALTEFERLHGKNILPPTPGTEKAPYAGSHGHPRMHRALAALKNLANDLSKSECQQDTQLDAMRNDVTKAISAIYDAFTFNPPNSGH